MPYTDVFGGSTVQPSTVEFSSVALATSIPTYWPSYATTGKVLARVMEVTASAPGLAITLPDATLAGAGQDVLFNNVGSETFSVLDNAGGSVATVAAGQVKYLYLGGTSTAAGTWRVTVFGVGASALDASQLAGSGIKAIGASLNQSMPVSTVSTNQSVNTTYRAKNYTNTGAGITYSLPLTADVGNDFFFAARNQGSGVLELAPTGGELIDGLATIDLQLDESCLVVAGTGAWYTVGRGRNPQFNFTQLSKTVTGGAVALSLSEASNVLQNYNGTLLSNCTVTLPAVVQVYYISNTTTGAYTLTFRSPVSGTTFVLPTNQAAVVFCDGVNVTNTTTTISGVTSLLLNAGSASNPSLAIASPDNGVFAPSSSAVAVTNGGVEVTRWSGGQTLGVNGIAAAPVYSFASDTGLGLYRAGVDTLGFSTASTARMTLGATGVLAPAADGTQDLGTSGLKWGAVYAASYTGAGTGLTGTAAALSIGGNAATATSATNATNATNATTSTTQAPGTSNTSIATTAFIAASFAPLASPTFTGTPVAPTPTLGDNTTKVATTEFVLANSAGLASPAFTGTPTAPTAAPGTNTTQIATTAFANALAFQSALPSQTGNAGKVPTTDGTSASWTDVKTINGAPLLGSAADLALEQSANKDTTGGYAGLTLLKINFKNAADTFTSFFTNANTASRTYTFQDKDGTVAMSSDTLDAASKTTPVDADLIPIVDSAASNVLKKLTWANLKAASGPTLATVSGTTQTAVAGYQYTLTNVGATTVTLPASPVVGDKVIIKTANGLETNVVDRNGNTIEGIAENMTIDSAFAVVNLQYLNGSWRLV